MEALDVSCAIRGLQYKLYERRKVSNKWGQGDLILAIDALEKQKPKWANLVQLADGETYTCPDCGSDLVALGVVDKSKGLEFCPRCGQRIMIT